jgi:RES domain-containing protein
MQVWRICAQRHIPHAFSGIGAEKIDGRWNLKGRRMVYTSSSLSLAALELFVHLEPNVIPDDLHAVSATIPEDASREAIAVRSLPKDWRDYPAPSELQEIGSRWLEEQRSLILMVPSAINPVESNCLLNPAHPEANRITDIHSQPFHFDPRMWKSQ